MQNKCERCGAAFHAKGMLRATAKRRVFCPACIVEEETARERQYWEERKTSALRFLLCSLFFFVAAGVAAALAHENFSEIPHLPVYPVLGALFLVGATKVFPALAGGYRRIMEKGQSSFIFRVLIFFLWFQLITLLLGLLVAISCLYAPFALVGALRQYLQARRALREFAESGATVGGGLAGVGGTRVSSHLSSRTRETGRVVLTAERERKGRRTEVGTVDVPVHGRRGSAQGAPALQGPPLIEYLRPRPEPGK